MPMPAPVRTRVGVERGEADDGKRAHACHRARVLLLLTVAIGVTSRRSSPPAVAVRLLSLLEALLAAFGVSYFDVSLL
jgi:hypothetical protein